MRFLAVGWLAVTLVHAAAAQQKKRPANAKPASPPASATVIPADPTKTVFPIETLAVEGNKKIPAEKIIAASGLKIGQPALKADFDKARDRLVASGAFLSVAYDFKPSATQKGYAGVFQVIEMEPLFPVVFEDLPAPDAVLRAALREREPLLGDEIPGSREMIARYVADLENALELLGKGSVKVTGRVISDDVKRPAIVFRPPGSRPNIARVQFVGNEVLPSTLLVNTLSGVAVGVPFSDTVVKQLLETSVRPLYEARGRLRVTFPKYTTERDSKVDGLVLTVTVSEGPSYKLGTVKITGVPATDIARLDRMANWKTGDVANFDEIEAGVDRVKLRLKEEGHLRVAVNLERTLNDTDRTVNLVAAITPGPRFVYGKLEIKGLDILSEPVIRKMWGDRAGKPFNPAFPDAFLADVRDQGLFDNLGKTNAESKINDAERTVDVTLYFAGQGPDKDQEGRKKRIPL
jgi:outer membrane protein assembly factor BamA